VQNKALLLKNLHKFYNKHDIPWVNLVWNSYYSNGNLPGRRFEGSFWWKAHLKLIDTYKAMARCNIGDGKSAMFWTDLWENECLHHKFPHLVTFAKGTNDSVHDFLHQDYLQDAFNLPLSQQAYVEFIELENICNQVQTRIQQGEIDSWSYIWGSGQFSSQKAYKVMMGYQPAPPHFSWIWNSSCQAKHKFFFWLLLHDRLNTRNLLGRKNFQLQSYVCTVDNCNHEETLAHLFWACPFSAACWDEICPARHGNLSTFETIIDMRSKLNLPFSMEIIMISAWSIWITRNNAIFNNQRHDLRFWRFTFRQEISLLKYRIKKKHANTFKEWLQSQV
jgi:hypothetical protein